MLAQASEVRWRGRRLRWRGASRAAPPSQIVAAVWSGDIVTAIAGAARVLAAVRVGRRRDGVLAGAGEGAEAEGGDFFFTWAGSSPAKARRGAAAFVPEEAHRSWKPRGRGSRTVSLADAPGWHHPPWVGGRTVGNAYLDT